MEVTFGSRLMHAWNAFLNRDPMIYRQYVGPGYSYRPDRIIFSRGNERSIISSIYNRIALDASSIKIQHVRLDEEGRFEKVIDSGLNNCLTMEANIDQTGRAFIQDVVMSMLDEGCVAIVPVDTSFNPNETGSFDIDTMRTGKILDWYPKHVKVRVYNDRRGEKEDLLLPKETVAIVENPFYAVMNEPNSTMQRLIRKLNLLDAIDEQSGSGKLNLIIQLPYVIKTEARRQQAEKRRKDIEDQLSGSKYGVAYTDGTERVVQLNRPIDNNHEGLSKEQARDLMSINDDVESIYRHINQMLRDGDFTEIEMVLALRDQLFESIAEAIKSELGRINEARSNTKASMLYLTILTETKNMVLQSRNLLKSQQYFLKHRAGAPQRWIKPTK